MWFYAGPNKPLGGSPGYNPPMLPMISSGLNGQAEPPALKKLFDPWHIALYACLLLSVIFGARLLNDSDLGYHLKGGQWILENHQVPALDPFTYTVPDHPYLDIHWLYQIGLYTLYRLGNYPLISLANSVFILLLFFLTWKRLRLTGAPFWMCVVLLAAALAASEYRFRARPETLSWILMSLTLWVLETRAARGRDFLLLLPFIMLVWVNVEGLFAIGLGLMALYCLSSFLAGPKVDLKLCRYSALGLAACLVNPYFIKGLVFPLTLLNTAGTSNVFKQAIFEFQSPWTMGGGLFAAPTLYLLVYKLFCVFLFLAFVLTYRQRKIHEYLMFFILLGLSIAALRNIQIFMIACAPLAASCWKDLKWDWLRKIQGAVFGHWAAPWIFTLLILGFCARVLTGAYYLADRRPDRFGLGLDRGQVPAGACEFLDRNHLDGRIFNQFNSGGWLEWLTPGKAFIDGRLEVMGEEFFSEYKNAQASGGLKTLLDKYHADLLMFNPFEEVPWIVELQSSQDWRPVYLDENSAIYLRKGYSDSVADLDYAGVIAMKGVSKSILMEKNSIIGMNPETSGIGDFFDPPDYPRDLQSMAVFCAYNNHLDMAEALYLEAIRRTRGKFFEFYYNLGAIYTVEKRMDDAELCMKRARSMPHRSIFGQAVGNVSGN